MVAQKQARATESSRLMTKHKNNGTKFSQLSEEFIVDSDAETESAQLNPPPSLKAKKASKSAAGAHKPVLSGKGPLPKKQGTIHPVSSQTSTQQPKSNGTLAKPKAVTSSRKITERLARSDASTASQSSEETPIINGNHVAPKTRPLVEYANKSSLRSLSRTGTSEISRDIRSENPSEDSNDNESDVSSDVPEISRNGQLAEEKQSQKVRSPSRSDTGDGESSNAGDTSTEDSLDSMELDNPKSSVTSKQPSSPAAVNYNPPGGFQRARIDKLCPSASLFSPQNLDGKQIWHLVIPSSVPLTTLKGLDLPGLSKSDAALSYEGSDYLLHDSNDHLLQKHVLVPEGKANYYNPTDCKVSRTLQLKLMVTLPQLSNLGLSASSSTHRVYSKPVPQQPEGLRMRYRPFGDVDEEKEVPNIIKSPPQFQIPLGVIEESRGGKRKVDAGNVADARGHQSPHKKRKRDKRPSQHIQSVEKLQATKDNEPLQSQKTPNNVHKHYKNSAKALGTPPTSLSNNESSATDSEALYHPRTPPISIRPTKGIIQMHGKPTACPSTRRNETNFNEWTSNEATTSSAKKKKKSKDAAAGKLDDIETLRSEESGNAAAEIFNNEATTKERTMNINNLTTTTPSKLVQKTSQKPRKSIQKTPGKDMISRRNDSNEQVIMVSNKDADGARKKKRKEEKKERKKI